MTVSQPAPAPIITHHNESSPVTQPLHLDSPLTELPSESEGGTDANSIYCQLAALAEAAPKSTETPKTLREALNGPDAMHWQVALDEELKSLAEKKVYRIVPRPKGVKIIGVKPVMRIKVNASGDIERYKLRLVAQGYNQKKGVDYQESYSPTLGMEVVRIIAGIAAAEDLDLHQLDVSTAYLNGKLEEEVYLMPPDGVECPPGHVWALDHALYGLPQSGHVWNVTLHKALLKIGFTRISLEYCLYILRDKRGHVCYLAVYVDDLLVAAKGPDFTKEVKRSLRKLFKMHDIGEAKHLLGIEITRDRAKGTIALSQRQYILKILEKYALQDCKPVSSPMAHGSILEKSQCPEHGSEEWLEMQSKPFKNVIGSLMYAMIATRPDICYAVGALARFSANPGRVHWIAAKRILRYLHGTMDLALTFTHPRGKPLVFYGYSDSNWSGDPDTSRSTSGYVFMMGGAAIAWSSKLQGMVALSSTEAEYIGLTAAAQEIAWLRELMGEIGYKQSKPTLLLADNQGSIVLTKNPGYRSRTKHIARKFHYVREVVNERKWAVVDYCPTEEMLADILTKALPREKHEKLTRGLGLVPRSSGSVRIHE